MTKLSEDAAHLYRATEAVVLTRRIVHIEMSSVYIFQTHNVFPLSDNIGGRSILVMLPNCLLERRSA